MKFKKNKLGRRALALALAAGMCFSMLQVGATAATTTISAWNCGEDVHYHSPSCYTTETTYVCGMEETAGHTHNDSCYQGVNPIKVYTCNIKEEPGHLHTDSCYTYTNTLTCTLAESQGHAHGEACYGPEGNLICTTPEGEGHAHSESCYTSSRSDEPACGLTESPVVHNHTDACPHETVYSEKVLICQLAEAPAHQHTESCQKTEQKLSCKKEQHQHTEACKIRDDYQNVIDELKNELNKKKPSAPPAPAEPAEPATTEGPATTDKPATTEPPVEDPDAYHDTILLVIGGVVLGVNGQIQIINGQTVIIVNDGAAEDGKLESEKDRIFAVKDGQLVVDGDVEMTNGKGGGGGAIYVGANGNVTMNNGSITNSNSTAKDGNGGAVLVDGGNFTMNGGTISGNHADKVGTGSGGGVAVDKGGSFTMNGGTISDNSTNGNGGGVSILDGDMVMNGGTISNNNAANGGGIYVGEDGKLVINGGTIDGNKTAGSDTSNDEENDRKTKTPTFGGGVYIVGGDFTLNGGTISNNQSIKGGGVAVDNGTFNMNGGTIDNNYVDDKTWNKATYISPNGQGGGVYVIGKDGKFTLIGGTISNNTAGEGGGVFIADDEKGNRGSMEMNGGKVTGNTANIGEGGGIYVQGDATIVAGEISNNVTNSKEDLGGGALYIEHSGKVNLKNALVTNNAAAGLGAGLSACVNGKTVVFAQDGAAIYDNTSGVDKDGNKLDEYGHIIKEVGKDTPTTGLVDGYENWKDKPDFQAGSKDVLIASDGKVDNAYGGKPGAIFSNEMLGGGLANWSGSSYVGSMENEEKIDGSNNGVVTSDLLLGMQSDPLETAKKAAEALAKVLIFGNYSSSTHGGGIANNGTLIIGTDPNNEVKGMDSNEIPTIDLDKTLVGRPLENGEFSFDLVDAEGNPIEDFTVTNDENGKAQIRLPEQYFTAKDENGKYVDGDYVFYIKEKIPDETGNITYDDSNYRVVISVETVTENKNIQIGSGEKDGEDITYTITKRKIPYEPIKEKEVINSLGNAVWSGVNNIHFVNQAHPTEPPRETPPPTPTTPPTPTPTPSEEPTPPPTEEPTPPPSEEPDEPIEDPDLPLGTPEPDEPIDDPDVPLGTPTPQPDEPDEEVPEPEIPKGPSEPEEELPEPEVPLADVPKTGDSAALWYILTFVCAGSLAGLALCGRRKKTVK